MNQSRRSDEAYDHPRENGWHPDDQTAYLASQQHWGLAEQHRPDILFQWKPDGHQDPPYTPGDWICPWTGEPKWNGKTGDFFKDWRDIPQQLSSRVEGWLMEAISRTDSRIKIDDFLVRIRDDVEDKPTTTNRLQMRKKRFREVYKLRTWNASRAGTDWWNEQVDRELTDEQKARNTTRGLPPATTQEAILRRKMRSEMMPRGRRRGPANIGQRDVETPLLDNGSNQLRTPKSSKQGRWRRAEGDHGEDAYEIDPESPLASKETRRNSSPLKGRHADADPDSRRPDVHVEGLHEAANYPRALVDVGAQCRASGRLHPVNTLKQMNCPLVWRFEGLDDIHIPGLVPQYPVEDIMEEGFGLSAEDADHLLSGIHIPHETYYSAQATGELLRSLRDPALAEYYDEPTE